MGPGTVTSLGTIRACVLQKYFCSASDCCRYNFTERWFQMSSSNLTLPHILSWNPVFGSCGFGSSPFRVATRSRARDHDSEKQQWRNLARTHDGRHRRSSPRHSQRNHRRRRWAIWVAPSLPFRYLPSKHEFDLFPVILLFQLSFNCTQVVFRFVTKYE